MSKEEVVERILSDAHAEAQAILDSATRQAETILAEAGARAENARRETESEAREYERTSLEKKQAAARLESSKIQLKEKRRVIDTIYVQALSRLQSLEKEDALKLYDRLLTEFAEDGDEICFAENFRYAKEVSSLPVVAEKKLTIAKEKIAIEGGLRLKGKYSDKDLSFSALLAADREEYQASIAAELF